MIYFCSPRLIKRQLEYARSSYQDDSIETLLEPGHCILLLDSMRKPNPCLLLLPLRHPTPRTTHHNIEIHTKDTDARVVSSTKVDMFLNTKAKVASIREVLAS